MSITKYILPVVAGSIAAMVLIKVGEMGLYNVYPLPNGINVHDKESLMQAIRQMPTSAFLMLIAVYVVASFIGGLVATLVGNRVAARPAIAVGVVLTIAGMVNAVMVPNPIWFTIANLLIYLPSAYMGYLAIRRKDAPGTSAQ
jgi:MFS family permease